MAILKFRVYWEDDEGIYRDIAIKHRQTFEDLHKAILKSYEFDNKHKATFFRSNDQWQRGRQIVLEKYEMPYKAEPLMMAKTIIQSEIRDPNQKFIYLYDFEKNWTFHLEVINVSKDEEYVEYPYCVRAEGVGPSQYGTKGLVNEKLAEVEEKYDLHNSASPMPDGYTDEGEDGTNEGEESEGDEYSEE